MKENIQEVLSASTKIEKEENKVCGILSIILIFIISFSIAIVYVAATK